MLDILNYSLISYGIIALLLVMSPGADVILVLSSALRGGAWAGMLTAAGISIGSLIWALLAAIGLASILNASPLLFNIITYAGVAYMFYVGFGEIRAGMSKEIKTYTTNEGKTISWFAYVKKGMIVNLLNPKVGVFYIAFLPQFVPKGNLTIGNALLLGGIHILLGIIWLSGCSFAIDKVQTLINNPRFNKVLMMVAGMLIIGFALLILWSRIGT